MIADKIYERLTGEEGYFDTRILYVSENGPKNNRIKKLAIMDQDSFNHRYLTSGKELVLTPRFNPVKQEYKEQINFLNRERKLAWGPRDENEKSRVFVKVTKTKVLAAFGQIIEVLFSQGKFPIGIEPTPVPEDTPQYAHLKPKPPQ